MPLTTREHRRAGTRERLLDVRQCVGDRLKIELDALATRVLFDDRNRAQGVEYLSGANLYRAGSGAADSGRLQTVTARHEVILAGGAFNTPQLLMLSGIGPPEHLSAMGIGLRAALPGVGSSLQDRYEIGVVNRLAAPWPFYRDAKFSTGGSAIPRMERARPLRRLHDQRRGALACEGSSVAQGAPTCSVCCCWPVSTATIRNFSRELTQKLDYMTWVVLKAHTRNRAGTVRLRSSDPRDPPEIAFNYFQEGGDADLQAMIEGVQYVRDLGKSCASRGLWLRSCPDRHAIRRRSSGSSFEATHGGTTLPAPARSAMQPRAACYRAISESTASSACASLTLRSFRDSRVLYREFHLYDCRKGSRRNPSRS